MSFDNRLRSANPAATFLRLVAKAGLDAAAAGNTSVDVWADSHDGRLIHRAEQYDLYHSTHRCRTKATATKMTVNELAAAVGDNRACECVRTANSGLDVFLSGGFRQVVSAYAPTVELILCTQALNTTIETKPASAWAPAERRLAKALEAHHSRHTASIDEQLIGATVIADAVETAQALQRKLANRNTDSEQAHDIARGAFKQAGLTWRTNDIEVLVRAPARAHITQANQATLDVFAVPEASGLYAGPAELAVLILRHALPHEKRLRVELAVVDTSLPPERRKELARIAGMIDNTDKPLADIVTMAQEVAATGT